MPMEAVPLSTPWHSVAVCTTRLPLSPHCNPCSASQANSLGVFHRSPSVSLASFAGRVSRSDRGVRSGRNGGPRCSPIHPAHARQATSAHSVTAPQDRCTALQVHNLFRTQAEIPRGSTSVHKNRSPRKQGRVDHAIAHRPESASAKKPRFPPAPTQNWAYQAGTRGFIDMPFRGFLGPP